MKIDNGTRTRNGLRGQKLEFKSQRTQTVQEDKNRGC
jgi:hypothetical protein